MPAIQRGAQKGVVQWKLDVSSIVIDDDECLLNDDEKQFCQLMAKHSALHNARMPSGHQPKFQRWSSVLLGEEAAHRCALELGVRAVFGRSPLTRDRSG